MKELDWGSAKILLSQCLLWCLAIEKELNAIYDDARMSATVTISLG